MAFRFEGSESEIDVLNPGGGEIAEFTAWDWFPLAELPRLVVSYKRPVYERVAQAFAPYAARLPFPERLKPGAGPT